MLQGKKIILAVSGSIAAYKSALLVRLLVKQQAEVRVIMTEKAQTFITPLTLATLSKNPVLSDFVKDNTGLWNNHVDLGLWADVMIIAPATSNTLAKCAQGLCDNLLQATYLSARCPVFFAPAMDLDMYQHPATLHNLKLLESFGNQIIPSEHGELASGLVGQGRMAEPEHIVKFLEDFFSKQSGTLKGKKAIVTAGPTYEAIDPVRFIGNHSTGKMGYAIAESLANQGAEVTLVSGPSKLQLAHPQVEITRVTSAQQMYEATREKFDEANIVVLAAAVADFTPKVVADQKIKKKEGQEQMQIELVRTIDIAQTLGKIKKAGQVITGFAMETENALANAQSKLDRKNFDMIVLNSLNEKGAGFGHDTNKVTIIERGKEDYEEWPLKSKKEVANGIVKLIIGKLNSN
ncbi:phosphopantothenoylcysteine decarboxylase [marine bacterium AO1-C]|nr:phosphopantothenoylcysteine decarboxylase [marine bacterium AO1-C]